MLSEREVSASIGGTAYGANGDKLGIVEHFFVDDRTGAPSWVAVATGLFGTRHSIVPALDATFTDGALRVPVTADAVKGAPHLTGDHLAPDDEAALRRHYGMGDSGTSPVVGRDLAVETDPGDQPSADGPSGGGQHRAPDSNTDTDTDTDGAMTRSEEHLDVGTERVAATRARVIKYIVTEEVQITVPIRREEIRVEQVPIDAPDDGPGETLLPDQPAEGTAAGGRPGEIILHTERPVVTVEVVPLERVRLRTEQVQGQERVTEQVQREQIIVDQDAAPRAV
ncbi:MAG TPA: PRC and DUF2382 domain-containing protein [Modestobacter sp.]|nr:PRC and DUF2382 domain-containing protein [Modestobacter sp.]